MDENEYQIIELKQEDLPKCSSFWGYPNTRLDEFIKIGARRVFAYKTGDEYIGGCALITNETQIGHFSDFVVSKDLRGKGIGSRILEFSISFFKDKGMKTIRLHVNKENISAIRLYEKYGFRHCEEITNEKIAMIRTL